MYPEKLADLYKSHWEIADFFNNTDCKITAGIMPHYSIDMHSHAFCEINIVLGGTGAHYLGNEMFEVQKGDVFIIPPNIKHGYKENRNFSVLNVLIHDDFFKKNLSPLYSLPYFSTLFKVEPLMRLSGCGDYFLKVTGNQLCNIKKSVDIILNNLKTPSKYSTIICESAALILITDLCKYYELQHKNKKSPDSFFAASLSLIYEKYDEKITVARLASTANMSRSSYFKKFSDTFNTTPSELLLQCRIDAAKDLLSGTSLSISDIAEKTGFCDSSHFINIFSRQMNMSPSQYRKASQKALLCE